MHFHLFTILLAVAGLALMAFSFNVTVSKTITGLGPSAKSKQGVYTCDQSSVVDETIAIGATAYEIDWGFPINTLQCVYMIPVGGDLTIKTNSSSAPQETITLKNNVGLDWAVDEGQPIPFAGPITKIFVTNATGKQVKLACGAGFGDQI